VIKVLKLCLSAPDINKSMPMLSSSFITASGVSNNQLCFCILDLDGVLISLTLIVRSGTQTIVERILVDVKESDFHKQVIDAEKVYFSLNIGNL
jgi:hypothetical protein